MICEKLLELEKPSQGPISNAPVIPSPRSEKRGTNNLIFQYPSSISTTLWAYADSYKTAVFNSKFPVTPPPPLRGDKQIYMYYHTS